MAAEPGPPGILEASSWQNVTASPKIIVDTDGTMLDVVDKSLCPVSILDFSQIYHSLYRLLFILHISVED